MRFIILLCFVFTLLNCSTAEKKHKQTSKGKILFILSNQHTYGDTDINTSNHFAEIVLAYDVLQKEGYDIDFVSPKGGAIPIGYLATSDSIQKKYIYDAVFMNKLKNTFSPEDIKSENYKAVYYGGGGAAMFGVPEDKAIQDISMAIYEKNNGIISAICHGSAGLAYLKTKDGKYLVEGKKVNGFPDKFERMEEDYYATFPFSIEQKLKENGGDFEYSEEGWNDFSISDGRLITGQDPTAARSVAKRIIQALQQL